MMLLKILLTVYPGTVALQIYLTCLQEQKCVNESLCHVNVHRDYVHVHHAHEIRANLKNSIKSI